MNTATGIEMNEELNGDGIIEIRTYSLKPGTGSSFHRCMQEQSLPLLKAANVEVLVAGPSMVDADSYLLVRGYRDQQDRRDSQDRFYASPAWREGPRAAIIACIEHSIDVILPRSAALTLNLSTTTTQHN